MRRHADRARQLVPGRAGLLDPDCAGRGACWRRARSSPGPVASYDACFEYRILRSLDQLVPLSPTENEQVRDNIRNTLGAVVFGTLAVAVVQGTLGGLMFWWLDLPAPILWGAVMAILAILPLFGAALIWIPAAVYLAIDGDWNKALLLTAWGTLVVGLIDNLLYPLLVKNRLRIHTVPVFISVLGGIFVFGATGFVLGPLVLAVARRDAKATAQRMQEHFSNGLEAAA